MLALNQQDVLKALKKESTWKLFFLTVITLGLYSAFYMKRQSEVLNGYLEDDSKIGPALVKLAFLSAFLGIGLVFAPFIVPDDSLKLVETISAIDNLFYSIIVLIWGFLACTRMNYLLDAEEKGNPLRSSKWWVLLFGVFFVNFRINKMCKIEDL